MKAWLVKHDGSFFIYYGEKPFYDKVIDTWLGDYVILKKDVLPFTDELSSMNDDDEPIEVMLAPIDKVKVNVGKEFFNDLAAKMRKLWPAGDKDGKYAWRESVPALAKRLETLWSIRNLGKFSIDDCLRVCRQYLAEYEHQDTKYMQVVKYFVLKQKEVVDNNGRIRYISTSRFADMLEGINVIDSSEEFAELMSGYKDDNLV